jgi:hypothetical protein
VIRAIPLEMEGLKSDCNKIAFALEGEADFFKDFFDLKIFFVHGKSVK